VVEEQAPASGRLVGEAACAAEAPASAAEAPASAMTECYDGDDGCHGGASRTLEEEEAGLLQFEVSSSLPTCPCFRGWSSTLCFFVHRVAPTVPTLAPAKALRSDASVPTRRHSSRAPRAAGSAAAMVEPPRGTAVATGVKPRIFIENPNPCTIAIVPGSVAIAYRTSHR
jgi:hypothetical protein